MHMGFSANAGGRRARGQRALGARRLGDAGRGGVGILLDGVGGAAAAATISHRGGDHC